MEGPHTELTELIQNQQGAESRVQECEEQLRAAKKRLADAEHDFVEYLDARGLDRIETSDGTKVRIMLKHACTLPPDEEKREEALRYLDELGCGDLAKDTYTVELSREESDRAPEVQAFLDSAGLTYGRKRAVHPMTLGAFAKERLEGGLPFDPEKFAYHLVRKTKIT